MKEHPSHPHPATKEWDQTLRALVARLQTGEKQALALLYDQTRTMVFSLIVRILRDRAAAEEITLDVYLQAYLRAGEYEPHRGSPIAWLLNLARSRAIDHLRAATSRARREQSFGQLERESAEAADSAPEGALGLMQARATVQAALALLSAEQREVIERAYFDGQSGAEIAAALGVPLGTVKSRLRAAMMLLRKHLGPFLREIAS